MTADTINGKKKQQNALNDKQRKYAYIDCSICERLHIFCIKMPSVLKSWYRHVLLHHEKQNNTEFWQMFFWIHLKMQQLREDDNDLNRNHMEWWSAPKESLIKALCYETPIRTSFASLVSYGKINTGAALKLMYWKPSFLSLSFKGAITKQNMSSFRPQLGLVLICWLELLQSNLFRQLFRQLGSALAGGCLSVFLYPDKTVK